MNEQEKCLALAKLMGWEPRLAHSTYCFRDSNGIRKRIEPYSESWLGRGQFAAILLKYPEVMMKWIFIEEIGWTNSSDCTCDKPTQANILDEILRMEGKL